MKRQALHAASLRLQHPVTGRAIQLIGEFCFAKATFAACCFWLFTHYSARLADVLYSCFVEVLLAELGTQQPVHWLHENVVLMNVVMLQPLCRQTCPKH